ncbi:MAG: phytanoyl-CoA dioxygenase family protein, partial [Spartobacteria bacterium]
TRAVAGSHLSGKVPSEVMKDPKEKHPEESLLLGEAGTVFVFNSHTWHGGTINRTHKPRRAMHSYFCRRDQKQQLNQQDYLSPALIRSFSPAEKFILDVSST